MNRSFTLAAAAAAAAFATIALPAHAVISVPSPAFGYTESFDSLTTSTTSTAFVNDSTLPGWSLFISTLADAGTYAADNGASNTGSFRSYGVTAAADRALGALASGGAYWGAPASAAVAGYSAVAFANNSGSALAGFSVRYDGEQWRNGGNTTVHSLEFSYGFGASFGSVVWTAPGAGFDFASPVVGSTAAAVDGNVAGRLANIGGSVSAAWAPGQTLWLRWADRNDTGNDHGLSIDNLAFNVTAVPEPGTTALWLAGLAAIGFVARRRA